MARLWRLALLAEALCSNVQAAGAGWSRPDALPAPEAPYGGLGSSERRLQEGGGGSWVSPNPPSCVVDFADLLSSLIGVTQGLIDAMIACPPVFAEGITYARQQRSCAIPILNLLASSADSVADVEALAFDCFNQNQACGQAIASASSDLLNTGIAITEIIDICPFRTSEAAFTCYARIWNIVQLLVEAAKFIDVALATCPITEDLSEPTEPEGPAPEPVKIDDEPPEPTKVDEDSDDQQLFASAWSSLAAAIIPGMRSSSSDTVERRLAEPGLAEPEPRSLRAQEGPTVELRINSTATALLDLQARRRFADSLIEVEKRLSRALNSLPGSRRFEVLDFEQSVRRMRSLAEGNDVSERLPDVGTAVEAVVV